MVKRFLKVASIFYFNSSSPSPSGIAKMEASFKIRGSYTHASL
jgi:hypothetical protein